MGLSQELSSIKTNISDGVKNNKVSRFAYTEIAYTENTVDSVPAYNVNAEQNIPLGTAEVMKVNQTVIEKGWRARASSITRMLLNHFLGRISYNLNKANDMINSILGLFVSYIGNPDGIASLDSNAQVLVEQINKSDRGEANGVRTFSTKGAYDYSFGSATASSWLGKVFGKYLGRKWKFNSASISVPNRVLPYFANGLWILAQAGQTSAEACWSFDGKQWTDCTGIPRFFRMATPVFANGLWIAGSTNFDVKKGLVWSEDGKSWTQCTGDVANYNMLTPFYANGLWIAGSEGNGLWWSEDGKTWTQVTGVTSSYRMYSPVYADGLWVAGSYDHGLWWSEDGKNWTQVTGSTATKRMSSPVYANGIWLTCEDTGGLWWSEDGKNWTQGISANYTIYTPVYADGLWLFGTANHGLWWSEDGKTWTQITETNANDSMLSPVYANGLWLTGNLTHEALWKSENGKTWEKVNSFSDLVSGVTPHPYYANGIWFLGCNRSGDLLYSDVDMLKEEGIIVD